MNASEVKNVDWKYLVKYDGKEVGYNRVLFRPFSNGVAYMDTHIRQLSQSSIQMGV